MSGNRGQMPAPPPVADAPVASEAQAAAVEAPEMPVEQIRGIEVVAVRVGFYGQVRRKAGDRFLVKSFEQVGEWMMPTDKKLALKHQANIAARKKKVGQFRAGK